MKKKNNNFPELQGKTTSRLLSLRVFFASLSLEKIKNIIQTWLDDASQVLQLAGKVYFLSKAGITLNIANTVRKLTLQFFSPA